MLYSHSQSPYLLMYMYSGLCPLDHLLTSIGGGGGVDGGGGGGGAAAGIASVQ